MSTLTIYTAGTITFTNGSANLTGAGTTFIGLQQGDPILAPDGKWYELAAAPTDNSAAALDRVYAGTTATNATGGTDWVIFRSSVQRDSVRTATKQLTDISSIWRQLISLTQSDQVVKPSKATTGDRAGLVLAKALVDMFQVGMFQDDDFSIRYLLASTWTKALAINGSTGATTVFAQLLLGKQISPAQITTDTHDYAPANLDQANQLRVSTSASKKLTGLTGGAAGRMLALMNTGSFDLVLSHEDVNSTAANRFGLGIDMVIPGGSSTILIYDGTASRWRPMGGAGGTNISVGTVTTGAPGSSVTVTNSGTAAAPTLDFSIPRGSAGQDGAAATIGVGTVTTGAPGSSVTVTNAGTSSAAVLNISIPQGATGAAGTNGKSYGGTTTTAMTVAIATGVNFTTQANLAYSAGNYVRLASTADGSNFMEGYLTAYNSATGAATINIFKINGTGTFTSWALSISTESGGVADAVRYGAAQTLTSAQRSQARANIDIQKKNYIINGGMQISQQNGATAGGANGYYPVDQWVLDVSTSGGAVSVAQVASVTPGGSPNRLRVTATVAQATVGSSYCILRQPLEGLRIADLLLGTASAKPFVVQVGVKGPAGSYRVSVPPGDFTGGVSGFFTIAAGEANTDVYKSVVFTGPTSGNYTTGNTGGAHMQVELVSGISGQFNFLGTSGNVFELFDVGLYEGSVAPAFQLPDFERELQACQRYWEKSYDYAVAPGAANAVGCEGSTVGASSGSFNLGSLYLRPKTRKRTAPTVVVYSDTTGASNRIRDRANGVDVAPSAIDLVGETGFRTYASFTSSATFGFSCHWTANARM